MMGLLYVLQAVLAATALILGAAAYPRLTGMPFAARSALALTMTPAVLGGMTLAIAALWPGAPRLAFLLLPGGLSLAALFLMRSRIEPVLAAGRLVYRQWHHNPRGRWMVQAGFLGIFVFAAAAAGASLGVPIGHDALIYLAEARAFAEQRTLAAIPGFEAMPGEVIKTHPHLFFWQAYLAQGLMATDGPLGHGHDFFARMAAQASFALVPFSVLCVARSVTPARTIWLAPLILLPFGLEYIPRHFSVDGFRIVTFLALVALLAAGTGRGTRWEWPRIVTIAIVAGIAAAAHTLDIAFVMLVMAAYVLLVALRLAAWRNILAGAVPLVVVLAPVLLPYAQNFAAYGNVLGEGMSYFSYRGTALWEAFAQQRHWMRVTDPITALGIFSSQYRFLPLLIALACALASLAIARRRRYFRPLAGLSVIFLVITIVPLLPFSGLQAALLGNQRYGLIVCAVAAPLVAAFLALPAKHCRFHPQRFWAASAGIAAGGIVCALAAIFLLFVTFGTAFLSDRYVRENELFVRSTAEAHAGGGRWATDRYSVAYFSSQAPLFLYTRAGHHLMAARTQEEVLRILRRDGIRVVALSNQDPNWWPRTQFYKVLHRLPGVRIVAHGNWRLFLLPRQPSSP